MHFNEQNKVIAVKAFKYSIPVLLGYIAIGTAFGLLTVSKGFPFWLAPFMSFFMYAGAAQYMAIGFFSTGMGITEMLFITFLVNARHIAYGLSMLKRFTSLKNFKPYLIFALTDETFALFSSLPDKVPTDDISTYEDELFLFFVAAFNQGYWVFGSLIGALVGKLLPFKLDGFDFALTALFIVLALEQVLRLKKPLPFIISATCTILFVLLFGSSIGIISAICFSLLLIAFVNFMQQRQLKKKGL